MPHLPSDHWPVVLASPVSGNIRTCWNALAAAGVRLDAPIDDEERPSAPGGSTGRKDAVRWLLDHGADPKKTDRYDRKCPALGAENGPGHACLAMLEGRPEPAPHVDRPPPTRPGRGRSGPGGRGARSGTDGAPADRDDVSSGHPDREGLLRGRRMPLSPDVRGQQHTRSPFNDTRSPRQDYLHGETWREGAVRPDRSVAGADSAGETLSVSEFDVGKADQEPKVPADAAP